MRVGPRRGVTRMRISRRDAETLRKRREDYGEKTTWRSAFQRRDAENAEEAQRRENGKSNAETAEIRGLRGERRPSFARVGRRKRLPHQRRPSLAYATEDMPRRIGA